MHLVATQLAFQGSVLSSALTSGMRLAVGALDTVGAGVGAGDTVGAGDGGQKAGMAEGMGSPLTSIS